jgi:restriction endonuclease S subunit
MQKDLNQIASVISGYTFRDSIENEPNGDIFVVQGKNVSAGADMEDLTELVKISSNLLRAPNFLKHNDILLVSRGSGAGAFRSTVFGVTSENVIASSAVHIIRITDVTVLPKYLSLYLNSLEGQKAISQIVTGASYIQSILVKNLADLKIPIPPIHIQKTIIALHENITQQERLRIRKRELQQNIINQSFTTLKNS